MNVLIPSSPSQQCNGLTIFWLSKKNEAKTQIKRSKIKLLYLLASSLFLLNRAKCSACADKFPTCLLTQHFLKNTAGHNEWRTSVFACKNARRGPWPCNPSQGDRTMRYSESILCSFLVLWFFRLYTCLMGALYGGQCTSS